MKEAIAAKAEVFFIDDEEDVRLSGKQTLELEGFRVADFASAEAALEHLNGEWPGVVLTDVRMPVMDGLQLFDRVRDIDPDIPVILVTAHGDISMAVAAMRSGAYDFIEKPAAPDHLVETVRRAMEKRLLVLENRRLRREVSGEDGLASRFIGTTPAIEKTRDLISALADTDVDVLILGETGTGKELAARCLHELGDRHEGRFVAINCGALPESVIESELFGHEAGAFTGANKQRIGKIEHASGGTLFLDEIESMPLAVQVRFLRVLQERVIERLGSNEVIPVDIRLVAAAKAALKALCATGDFREDLYFRLNVATLLLPTLRERRDDVLGLFHHFGRQAARRFGRALPEVDAELAAALKEFEWPGNIRELRNVAERFVLGLPVFDGAPVSGTAAADAPLDSRVESFERSLIADALLRHGGRIGETAMALGIPRKKLYLRMQKYGLDRSDYR